jgi:hypothetical protein
MGGYKYLSCQMWGTTCVPSHMPHMKAARIPRFPRIQPHVSPPLLLLQAGSGLSALFAQEVDPALTWDFIPWLRGLTRLPIILKVCQRLSVFFMLSLGASMPC